MSPLLEIDNLTVTLTHETRPFAVSRQNHIRLEKGEILGLIGESGCGKTLTTLALTGLLPKNGHIQYDTYLFDGKNIKKNADSLRELRGKGIAFIFQEPTSHLDPLFSIGEQIRETILHHFPFNKTQAEAMAHQLLEDVGLKPAGRYAKRFAHQLSGGMNQRAMIALALSCQPKLLVADEATTALDTVTKKAIIELVKRLACEKQLSVIWISHDISLMESFVERINVMYAGRVLEEGTRADVLSFPAHPYTKGLLACLPEHANGKEFSAIPGEPPDLTNLPQGCPFHPRCPYVMDRCLWQDPPFFDKNATQKARCFLLQKT